MKRVILSFLLPMLVATTHLSAQLMISQYYEGDSNDKCLEVTNMGSETIDLAAMGIRAYLFANERADDPANNVASTGQLLQGTLFPLESLVFCNGLATQPGYTVGTAIGVNFCGFNGDDLVVLSTATNGLSIVGSAWANRIDVVGNGTTWGMDIAYVRKNTILEPNPDFTWAEWNTVSLSAVNLAGPEESNYLGTHYSVLPVTLADFKATVSAENIRLTFTTMMEQSNAFFLVQRSGDEGKSFQNTGQITGQGDSSSPVAYEFIDKQPLPGRSYYRLQQVDFAGDSAFFGPIAVNYRGSASVFAEVRLWPVPTSKYLQISLPIANEHWQIEVFDQHGRCWLQQTAAPNETQLTLDLQGLRPGNYLLRWKNSGQAGQRWFLKV
ncbi:T9SS type A sorting domain-containing protein [Lewinella sp. LCG006]|uniref:T9SS type A sorting domain-containing protein n=1 Tax=Lewinella sp. LCG006 TaxID=3231911 RepID=UPI003460A74C